MDVIGDKWKGNIILIRPIKLSGWSMGLLWSNVNEMQRLFNAIKLRLNLHCIVHSWVNEVSVLTPDSTLRFIVQILVASQLNWAR